MASGALFGNAASRTQSKNLVEFRAGKMYMKGKMVHPDKRKGQVYVYQSDDSLMHFCWKDRTKGTVDDDLMIFPDDVEFKHVPQCTTGRVYVLKFKSTNKKMFFWMQEPQRDKDDEVARKVNEFLNNPPTPGSSTRGGGGLSGLPSDLAGDSDIQGMLGGMTQQQLMQLLGGMGMGGLGGLSSLMGGRPASAQSESAPPSRVQSSPGPRTTSETSQTPQQRPVTAAALPSQSPSTVLTDTSDSAATLTTVASESDTATDSSSATRQIMLTDLQNILSGLGAEKPASEKEVDLSEMVSPETMAPILANPEIQSRLMPFLPEGEILPKNEEELKTTFSTPQFQQAMASFSAALSSGQLGPLMGQFGLGQDVATAATQGDIEAFVKAMQEHENKQGEKSSGSEDKSK